MSQAGAGCRRLACCGASVVGYARRESGVLVPEPRCRGAGAACAESCTQAMRLSVGTVRTCGAGSGEASSAAATSSSYQRSVSREAPSGSTASSSHQQPISREAPSVASASSFHQQPVTREVSSDAAALAVKEGPEGQVRSLSPASDITVYDSDDSGASIFGLRSMHHQVACSEDEDALSPASQYRNDERASEERRRVADWRKTNLVEREETLPSSSLLSRRLMQEVDVR